MGLPGRDIVSYSPPWVRHCENILSLKYARPVLIKQQNRMGEEMSNRELDSLLEKKS